MKFQIYPRSLRQLILIGFVISLIPLAVLLWQSRIILQQVSQSSIIYAQQSIDLVRSAESLDTMLVDIERAIKQYNIVETVALRKLAQSHVENYLGRLENLCQHLPQVISQTCLTQQTQLNRLGDRFSEMSPNDLNPLFELIREQQEVLLDNVWVFLDESLVERRQYVKQKQTHMNLLLVTLVLATSALMFWMSGRLVAPVKILEEKIRVIGHGENQSEAQNIHFEGPEEFCRVFQHLNWLSARLEKLESLRQAFLRHAAHELKTPLSSIKEGCSILSEHLAGPLTVQQQEVVSLLDDGVTRLQYLTEQLLEYNYLLQQASPELKPLNIQELIDQSLSIYDLSFRQRQQVIVVDCQVDTILSDATLFMRILDNLLSNVQAYGEQNGKVLVQVKQRERIVEVIVANTGERLPKEQAQFIFKPFYRGGTQRHDSVKGTGLGLSIVQDCARLLGGNVDLIESQEYQFGVVVLLPQP